MKKPGLDPRSEAQQFEFAQIFKIEDVKTGAIVPGVVTNLTRFGAFVDIGVKQDGLVHISQLSNKFISDPNEAVKLNQKVTVVVLDVDVSRKRISLSIKEAMTKETAGKLGIENKILKIVNKKETAGDGFQDKLMELKKKFRS